MPPPAAAAGDKGNSSSITNIGSPASSAEALRPRTGSVDLALGVGVGLCLGGAAVFVVLMTRFKRAPRWPHQAGQGSRGFGYDGVRLHGGGVGAGAGRRGGMPRWPRRQTDGFPIRGRRGKGGGRSAKTGPKEVALELGRVGFDYDRGREFQDFAALKLRDQEDRDPDLDYGSAGGVSDRGSGVHRRPGSGDGGGGLGLAPTRSYEGRRAGSGRDREGETAVSRPPSPSLRDTSEHDTLLGVGGGGSEQGRGSLRGSRRDDFGERR